MKSADKVTYRRNFGLILGTGLGLVYGLVSQSINHLYLPHIPLYHPPFGLVGNIILWILIGMLLGLLASLPNESIAGAFLGGLTGALLLTIFTLSTGRMDAEVWTGKIISVVFLFFPLAGGITPLAGIQRWVVNKMVEARLESEPVWKAIPLPLLLLVVVGALGTLSKMPSYARIMVSQMDGMLRAGMSASQLSQLPEPLQQERVGHFLENASSQYYLEWQHSNINRFAIPRPMSNRPWEESVIIARFDNGWNLVCLYAKSDAEPACKGYQNGF